MTGVVKPITALSVILIALFLVILAVIMYGNMDVIRHNSGSEPVNRTINGAEHECFVLKGATYCCKHEPDYRTRNLSDKSGVELYVTQCVRFSKV